MAKYRYFGEPSHLRMGQHLSPLPTVTCTWDGAELAKVLYEKSWGPSNLPFSFWVLRITSPMVFFLLFYFSPYFLKGRSFFVGHQPLHSTTDTTHYIPPPTGRQSQAGAALAGLALFLALLVASVPPPGFDRLIHQPNLPVPWRRIFLALSPSKDYWA